MATYRSSTPFGALKPLPRSKQQKPRVYHEDCYICNDPDYSRYGLPLCSPCEVCGGHVAAAHTVCDICGWDYA